MAKVSIGATRITASANASQAQFTRSTRASLEQVQRNLTKVINSIQDSSVRALKYGLQPMKDTADRYCPKDTGDLVKSGYLIVRREGRDKVQAEIGYGRGGNPPYSVFVHERTDLNHKAPTRAKWLQIAVQEKLGGVTRRVRAYIKAEVGL